MKKLSAIILILALTLCLGSCFKTGGGEGGGGEAEANLIYDAKTDLYLVYDPLLLSENNVNLIADAFAERGIFVKLRSSSSEAMEHEIVVGGVGREISDAATVYLDRIDKNGENDYRYCIYSDGSSLAIVYDEDKGGFAADRAVEAFISEFVKDKLVKEKGVCKKEAFDLYEYIGERDSVALENYWASVSKRCGESGAEMVSALQYLYSIYDGEGLVKWFANLYDPDICVCTDLYGELECSNTQWCHTGGFYFSNSARNTIGFLPDVESTIQALKFINESGMLNGVGDVYSDVLPDEINTAIKNFAYNLQDPDGYFYHPQWGTAIGTSRRARDYNWAISILKNYNVTPRYKTLADVPSEDSVSYSRVTERLSGSTVSMVSKVVLTESATLIPEHLKTLEAFEKYLIDLDIANNSYSAGNTLSAQSSQIASRGASYGKLLIEHLDAINIEYGNGTWHHTVDYYAINGVMKISGVYSAFKAPIPNAKAACLASFRAVSSDESVDSIVDIWNTWEALDRVLSNIRSYGEKDVDTEIVTQILPDAASAIRVTRDKLSKFCKPDGSFVYQGSGKTSGISMGAQVSVTGTDEGDVNATVIGSSMMVSSIFHSLRLGTAVPIALTRERTIFLDLIENVASVNKTGTLDEATAPITFDYYEEGEVPGEVRIFSKGNSMVVPDTRDDEGMVLLFNSIVGGGDYFKLSTAGHKTGVTGMVFESEFCFDSSSSVKDNLLRLEMGAEGDVDNAYRLVFGTTDEGVSISEHSSSTSSKSVVNHLASVDYGQWFKLKVIYYKGDHNTVRIKVYLDDKLLAISDNYYDKEGVKLSGEGTPNTNLSTCRFYVLKDYDLSLYIDNIRSYYTKKNYEYEPLHEDYRYLPTAINVDEIAEEAVIYGFEELSEGENYPISFVVDKGAGEAEVALVGDNKALSLSGGAKATVPTVIRSRIANCSSVSLDVIAKELSVGDSLLIELLDRSSADLLILGLTLKKTSETTLILLDDDGNAIDGVALSGAKRTSLRIDHYPKKGAAVIYVDGVKRGMCLSGGSKNLIFGKVGITAPDSEMLIDNVSVERCESDYDKAIAPAYEGKVYGFDNGIDKAITTQGSGFSTESVDGEQMLKFVGSSSVSAGLSIPVNKRDEQLSYTELSLDLFFRDFKKDGILRSITLTDESGMPALAIAFKGEGDRVGVAEMTSFGAHAPLAYVSTGEKTEVRIEYYEAVGVYKVFVGGAYAFTSSLLYSSEASSLEVSFATVSSGEVASVAYLDNISLDRYGKLYIAEPATQNKENGESTLTFNYSSGANYPSGITHDINSGAPKPSVVEAIRDGAADKVLKFRSFADASDMDALIIQLTEKLSSHNSYALEADIMLDECAGGSTFFQLYLRDGTTGVVELTLAKSGDSLALLQKDYVSGKNGEKKVIGSFGEWINLRVEYYAVDNGGEKEIRTVVFINDTLLFVSDIPYKNVTGAPELSSVCIKALKGPSATLYIDNLSFRQSADAYSGGDVTYTVE